MGLRLQIDEKYKSALKSKNSYEINTIRLIKSAIKNKDIENRTKENQELINKLYFVLIDKKIFYKLFFMFKIISCSMENYWIMCFE